MRLHHVSIPVQPGQLGAGRAFYADVVGLREIPPPKAFGTERVVWFDLGGCELHLFIEDDANESASGRHLALAVDDLDEVQQRLAAHAVELLDADPIPNRPRCFFLDPFGNRVEITQIVGAYH